MFGSRTKGNWHVYGIALPDDVLQKIYVTNAERLVPPEASIEARLADLAAGAALQR
jgi:hypothetical protein